MRSPVIITRTLNINSIREVATVATRPLMEVNIVKIRRHKAVFLNKNNVYRCEQKTFRARLIKIDAKIRPQYVAGANTHKTVRLNSNW